MRLAPRRARTANAESREPHAMARRALVVALALAAVALGAFGAASAGALPSCTDTYSGATGGDWDTAGNWSSGVPGSSDVACIPTGVTVDVEESGDAAAAIEAVSGAPGSVNVTSGSLTLGASDTTDTSNVTNLTVGGGTFTVEDTLAVGGNFQQTLGTIEGTSSNPGTMTVAGNFDLTSVSGMGTSTFGPYVSITQNGSGTFAIGDGNPEEELVEGTITTNTTDMTAGAVFVGPTITGGSGSPAVTSTSEPIGLSAASYQGGGATVTLTAPGFVTSGATTMGAQTLVIDGSDSSLTGLLTIENGGLTLDSGDTLSTGTTGDGVDFDDGTSTLSGTVDGTGTFETTHSISGQYPTVTIASGAGYTVPTLVVGGGTLNDNLTSISLTRLTIDGEASLDLGSGDAITDSGNFTEDTGTLQVPSGTAGTLTVDGNFDFTSVNGEGTASIENMDVTQNGSGTFAIGDGSAEEEVLGDATITTNTTDTSAGAVTVDGTITGGTGSPMVTSVKPITLGTGTWQAGGTTVTLKAPGFVTTADTTMGAQELLLDGSDKSSITGTLTLTNASDALDIPSGDELTTGTSAADGIVANNAILTIAGTLDGSGSFTAENYGTTTVTGTFTVPTITLESVATFDDEQSAQTITVTSLVNNNGHLNIDGGDTIDDTGNYTQTMGTLGQGGSGMATLDVGGNLSVTSVSGQGTATVGSESATNNVDIDQTGTGTFAITGAPSEGEYIETNITTGTTGTVTLDDSIYCDGDNWTVESTSSPITLTPSAGGYGGFDCTLSAPGFKISGNTNLGSLTLAQTGGSTDIPSGDDVSAASAKLSGGTLQDDGTIGSEATTPVTLTGGTLDGTGIVDGAVTNTSGTVSPGDAPGTLAIHGDYSQGTNGTLSITDDGTGAGEFSVLAVTGSASLAGTLAMAPSSAYANSATQGDEIEFLTATSQPTGTFATVSSTPVLQSGESYSAVYDLTDQTDALVGAPQAPVNTSPPVLSGTPVQGQQVSVTTGTWSNGPDTFTYQWEDCTSTAASSCTPISGATSDSYTLAASDVGHYITVIVSAHNVSSTVATATPTPALGPVTAPPAPTPGAPSNTSAPSISGTDSLGQTLSCSTGGWSPTPSSFSYQWERSGSAIAGATSSTYTVSAADQGATLTCVVTASIGSAASAPAASSGVSIPASLLLRCSGAAVTLVSVLPHGGSVELYGLARTQYAGDPVKITVSALPKRLAKRFGGTATVGADGSFSLRLRAPSGPGTAGARYTATVAGHSSLALKLHRLLEITAEANVSAGKRVTFQTTQALGAGLKLRLTQELSCTKTTTYKLVALPPSGKLTLTLPAPSTPGDITYYRAVLPFARGTTYSLPIEVDAAG